MFALRSFAVAAAMFMNSNSLPIALMQSLVVTVPGLKWGPDDSGDAMVGRALTYLVLYSTLGMVVRWSYGVRLLSQADPETTDDGLPKPPESPLLDREETSFPPSSDEYRVLQHGHDASETSSTLAHGEDYPSIAVHSPDRLNSDPKFFYSFPNSPYSKSRSVVAGEPSVRSAPSSGENSEDEGEDALEFPGRRRRVEPSSSALQSRMRRLRHRIAKVWTGVSKFMTVPLWAALASLVVACIPWLQHTLEVHVKPIKGALNQAGRGK